MSALDTPWDRFLCFRGSHVYESNGILAAAAPRPPRVLPPEVLHADGPSPSPRSSGSRSASSSIIWPTLSPTPALAASIQLKGEMASWNRVPHIAVNTHNPHPLYLTITITRIKMVTISLNAPTPTATVT